MRRPPHIWSAAAVAAAGLLGVLVFQGMSDQSTDAPGDDGRTGPVKAHSRTTALRPTDGGTRAALTQRDTEPFSMLGITWTDPSARITGTVEARTRAAGSGKWSNWLKLDGDSGQGESAARRGGTEPAWSDPRTAWKCGSPRAGRRPGSCPPDCAWT
ncbi:hypothetical protein GCM10027072_62410 [Streptomyces bullii]